MLEYSQIVLYNVGIPTLCAHIGILLIYVFYGVHPSSVVLLHEGIINNYVCYILFLFLYNFTLIFVNSNNLQHNVLRSLS